MIAVRLRGGGRASRRGVRVRGLVDAGDGARDADAILGGVVVVTVEPAVTTDAVSVAYGVETPPYRAVAVTLRGDTTVVRNGRRARLIDLVPGDRLRVRRSPFGTCVLAIDPRHEHA